jgi:hypothetical protein
MWRELLQQGKDVIQQFCRRLRGADRRAFQAEVAAEVCGGSPRRAESMFGWCRQAVQKGLIEQEYQVDLLPHFARRGRRTCEAQSPTLARVSTELLDEQSQTDPKFQTNLLYTRVTGEFLRSLLQSHAELADSQVPAARTCRRLMNRLGFCLRPVQKTKPLAKIPETDAIFAHLQQLHRQLASDPTVLRISIDTKAKVAVGPYSRHGRCRSRVPLQAADHDLRPAATLVPLGILEVDSGQLFISFGISRETSDFIADGIEPYHSKYNPVERCWSCLERHWNGALLTDVNTALQWAQTMTWKGLHPIVQWVTTTYERGKRMSRQAFAPLAQRLQRSETLPRWSVLIEPLRAGPAPVK